MHASLCAVPLLVGFKIEWFLHGELFPGVQIRVFFLFYFMPQGNTSLIGK